MYPESDDFSQPHCSWPCHYLHSSRWLQRPPNQLPWFPSTVSKNSLSDPLKIWVRWCYSLLKNLHPGHCESQRTEQQPLRPTQSGPPLTPWPQSPTTLSPLTPSSPSDFLHERWTHWTLWASGPLHLLLGSSMATSLILRSFLKHSLSMRPSQTTLLKITALSTLPISFLCLIFLHSTYYLLTHH